MIDEIEEWQKCRNKRVNWKKKFLNNQKVASLVINNRDFGNNI